MVRHGCESASSASTSVTMSAPETVTANFSSLTGITIQTNPAGLQFTVNGGAPQAAPQTLTLAPGSYTLSVASTQAGAAGTQYVFAQWSDSGPASHSITVTGNPATYTASFTTQYLLTTAVSPAGGGSVAANPPSAGYYGAGTSVQVTASANAGFTFASWSGDLSGTANPQFLTHEFAAHGDSQFQCRQLLLFASSRQFAHQPSSHPGRPRPRPARIIPGSRIAGSWRKLRRPLL